VEARSGRKQGCQTQQYCINGFFAVLFVGWQIELREENCSIAITILKLWSWRGRGKVVCFVFVKRGESANAKEKCRNSRLAQDVAWTTRD
jgi:hypothetical protein